MTIDEAVTKATEMLDGMIEQWVSEYQAELRREGWCDEAVAIWGSIYAERTREKTSPDRERLVAWIRRGGNPAH